MSSGNGNGKEDMTILTCDETVVDHTLDFDRVNELIRGGYITKRKHPFHPLWILNYSAKAQYDRHWTPETLACRGLVVDEQNRIVARAFDKFHNYSELAEQECLRPQWERLQACLDRKEPYRVMEKMDGSLILVFDWNGYRVSASRGSFESEQEHLAWLYLISIRPQWHPTPGITYAFELIHPENRIVVDYGDRWELVLLAAFDTATGREVGEHTPFGRPAHFPLHSISTALAWPGAPNQEGYVVAFESGFRFKVKFEEYKRLHKLLCGVTPKTIWENLAAGTGLGEIMNIAPDEWHEWMRGIEKQLSDSFCAIANECEAQLVLAHKQGFATRKEYAEFFKQCSYPAVLFTLLDGKDPAPIIWKLVKPQGGGAFRCSDE